MECDRDLAAEFQISSRQQKKVSTDTRELISENNKQVVIYCFFLDEDVTQQVLEGTDKQL